MHVDADRPVKLPAGLLSPSPRLITWLVGWEGPASLVPRKDTVGQVWDIGFGHVCARDRQPLATLYDAVELLQADVESFAAEVRRLVKTPLAQHQFDAVVAFAFNVGAKALATSTLLKLLNGGNLELASRQFSRWNRADGVVIEGLVKRRAAEQLMFVNADYSRRP